MNIATMTVASVALTFGLFAFADPANANNPDLISRRPVAAHHRGYASADGSKPAALRIREVAVQEMAVLR